ncbi:hypothetical protein [Microbacterium testaceum]|uniref:hypothetical protein n=1 Tax=Microbacterium testaceum TaxID=2033 RepID=UPI001245934E|nr:hypothetical protein [Microbacterium testaceum]
MRIRTTSTQRTYRYVRLALIGATVFLAVGVGIELARGDGLLSVSASYYTPAGPVFVGALSAIALALLALSGRSLEQGLLDVGAVLALVIAYVPTTISSAACPVGTRCVPPEVRATVADNAVAVASVVLLGVVAAVVLARVQGTASRGVALTVGVIVVLVTGGAVWAVLAPDVFLLWAHEVAAVMFFVLIAAVAALAAWRPRRSGRLRRGVRIAYAVVAGGIVLTLLLLVVGVVAGVERWGFPVVVVGEAVALALFAVFWLVQTVELWNEVDPTLRE